MRFCDLDPPPDPPQCPECEAFIDDEECPECDYVLPEPDYEAIMEDRAWYRTLS
jgi:hypothetical protein